MNYMAGQSEETFIQERDLSPKSGPPHYVGEVRYLAGARVAAKQRRASTSADGPRKNRSPTVGEAKLASALRSMPTTSTQVPHRKMANGNREPQYPALPRTTRAASMSTTAETALASRSADVSVAPPHAAPLKAIPSASST